MDEKNPRQSLEQFVPQSAAVRDLTDSNNHSDDMFSEVS